MKQRYVFPEVAQKVEQALQRQWRDKAFDGVNDSVGFAEQLTASLQELTHDKHVRVRFSVQPLPPRTTAEPTAEELARERGFERMRNYGVEKVERLPGNIGYIELRGFMDHEAGAETVAAAMNFLANTEALILDLRKNGGGSPRMVQLVCSYFFPADKPVHLNSLYWRKGDRIEEFWTLKELPGKRYLDRDIYVLTSRFTFSGAEECAYNLQTRKRATIVGETTGGGAHPGGGARLGDHFLAFIPTGRAINPVTKTNWEGTGVKPDVEVDADKALETAHQKAVQKFRETITDPEMKQNLEMDLRMEEMTKKRYEERNKGAGK
jgi:C-terminal processing protease CtpA/Prc